MSFISYNQLNNDGKIYALIDTVNVVFENCRLSDIFRWLCIDDLVDDFFSNSYDSSRGFIDLTVFCYNGIRIEIYHGINYMSITDDLSILDVVFPKFRIDISGSGHDYLRSRGIDFNTYRFVVPVLPEGASYHYTRFDFAYDFVNYKPEFMGELIDHITKHHLPNGRIPLCAYDGRQGSAVSASIRTVSQRTVYLGSAQSDRMLRIYDKSMQHKDLRTGAYVCDNPYGNPESWFRIELQMRRDVANALSRPCSDPSVNSFEAVLKDIMQRYCFADPNHNVHNGARPPVEFWTRLFDWHDITDRLIIPNEKRVESCSPDARVIDSFKTQHIRNFILVYTLIGKEGIEELINNYLSRLYDQSDPSHVKRLYAFNSCVAQLTVCKSLINSDLPGLSLHSGRYRWRW